MCDTLVEAGDPVASRGRKMHIEQHLKMLEAEFSGRPFIGFYHAGVTVHIRRNQYYERNVECFYDLWNAKADVLLKLLSARWLVSACDTIMDTSTDATERALALTGATLVNVSKLYESERFATAAQNEHVNTVNGYVQLFDGLTGFAVGKGDMIRNLFRRAERECCPSSLAGRILVELINRMKQNDTVFRRFSELHLVDDTRWQ